MKDKANIRDIARQSGVSISAVSLVLNNKPGVSQETRQRVLRCAEELGYPLKQAPKPEGCTPLRAIGMVVKADPGQPPQANPFYSKVIVGIEDACRQSNINLLFATVPVDENNRPLETPQLLSNDFIDGLLLVGTLIDNTFMASPGKHALPIVLVDGYSSADCYDMVVSDNFLAAYQSVEHLIALGHRHIGLVGSEVNCYPSLKERRNGYLRALKEHAIPDSYLTEFNIVHSKGYQETIDLLKENPKITALFCVNDEVGSAAIRAVQDNGKQIPGDISIIGYDDTYIAANTNPTLTTMHVDTVAMGRAAVRLLALRLENPAAARMTLTIHAALVERESVASSQLFSQTKVIINP